MGLQDKGMGIRIFSTREELDEIFEEMEPESSDEEDEDEDEDEDDETGVKNDDDDDDEFRVDGVMTSQLRYVFLFSGLCAIQIAE
jgi:tubulin---tyrosine ligase